MKLNREILDGIEEKLYAAHRQRPGPEPPPGWSWRVMAAAREAAIKAAAQQGALTRAYARLALGMAGAGAAVAAGLLVYVLYWGPDLDLSLARAALINPLGSAGWHTLWGS